MSLTWSDLNIPPLNLWNYPAWVVPSLNNELENKMLIELTEKELEAFKTIYEDTALYEYLDYDEEDKIVENSFTTLFIKLGINLTGEQDV